MNINWKEFFKGTSLVIISMFFTIILSSSIYFLFGKIFATIFNAIMLFLVSIVLISVALMMIFIDNDEKEKEEKNE